MPVDFTSGDGAAGIGQRANGDDEGREAQGMSDKNNKDEVQPSPKYNFHVILERFVDGSYFVSSPYTCDDAIQSMTLIGFHQGKEPGTRGERRRG